MGEMADYLIEGDDDEETGEYIGPGGGYPRSLQREKRESVQEKRKLTEMCKDKAYFVQKILTDNEYLIISVREIDYGLQIKTSDGYIINVYSTGKMILQGKENPTLKQLLNL